MCAEVSMTSSKQNIRVATATIMCMLALGCFLLLAHSETHSPVETMQEELLAMPPHPHSDDSVEAVLDDTDSVLASTGKTLAELSKDMSFDDLNGDAKTQKRHRSGKHSLTPSLILDENSAEGDGASADMPPGGPAATAAAAAAVASQNVAEAGDTAEENTDEEEGEAMFGHHNKIATVALCVVLMLIGMSVLFELGKDALFASTSTNFKPVLTSMFGELTLLGFVGLIMFCLGQTGALKAFSEELFEGEAEAAELLPEMCEVVHMALFLLMCLFLGMVIIWTKMAMGLQNEWKAWQHSINEHGTASCISNVEVDDASCWGTSDQRKELFTITRLGFIYGQMHMKGTKLGVDFDFAEYLSIHVGELLSELVEIPVASWGVVALMVTVLYSGYALTSFEVHSILMLLYSYALCITLHATARHLRGIREHIISPYLENRELAITQADQEETSDGLRATDEEAGGSWFCPEGDAPSSRVATGAACQVARKLDRKAKGVRPGTVSHVELKDQRAKFWWSGMKDGTGGGKTTSCYKFVMNLIRMCMLMQAALAATFLVAYMLPLVRRGLLMLPAEESCNLPHCVAVFLLLGMIPPVPLQLYMMPPLLADLGVATSVSTLWKQNIVERVLRWQTASKSIRALRLVAQMRISAKHAKTVSSPSKGVKGSSSQSVSDLVIKEMETSGKTEFTVDDLATFLQTHHIADADAAPMEAKYMMVRGDTNGDGLLDKEEVGALVEELGSAESELSAEDVAKHLFAHAGKKKGETLNHGDLHQLLESLAGTTVTEEDIKGLFMEADTDQSGGLDVDELATLLTTLASTTETTGAHAVLHSSVSAVHRMERTLTMVKVMDQMTNKDAPPDSPKRKTKKGMGVRQRNLLREIFDRFDDDGASDGTLSTAEFKKFLEAVGAVDQDAEESPEQQVADITKLLDSDSSGSISFEEFIAYAEANEQAQGDHEYTDAELCEELFKMLDQDHSGYISVHEIQQEIEALGLMMTMEDVYAVVKEADNDDDIQLDKFEFKKLLERLANH